MYLHISCEQSPACLDYYANSMQISGLTIWFRRKQQEEMYACYTCLTQAIFHPDIFLMFV